MSLLSDIEEYLVTTSNRNRFASLKNTSLWSAIFEKTALLPTRFTASQRVWHLRYGLSIPLCVNCNIADVKYDHNMHVYRLCCSAKCHRNYNTSRIKDTNQKRYGGPSPASSHSVRQKMAQTTQTRHGVSNISKLERIKSLKYDLAMARYGVGNVSQATEVRSKISSYQQSLSGEDRARISEQAMISAKAFRDYLLPSGRTVRIQGYENLALDILLNDFNEDSIIVGRSSVPVINYWFGGRARMHLPDIFIPDENKIIEVKSTFTFEHHRPLNDAKKEAAISSGFLYEFWIFDRCHQLTLA